MHVDCSALFCSMLPNKNIKMSSFKISENIQKKDFIFNRSLYSIDLGMFSFSFHQSGLEISKDSF